MKKLDDIPKKDLFEAPEGYFEKLPGVIQSRIAKDGGTHTSPVWTYRLAYASAVVVLLAVAGIFWFNKDQANTVEEILASVQTEELVAYLNDTDMSTEELLEDVTLSTEDALDIEGEVYDLQLDATDIEDILDDIN